MVHYDRDFDLITDAGGPLEFITHKKQGLITAPNAAALGRAFEQIMQDAALAEKLGQRGHARYQGLGIFSVSLGFQLGL